MGLRVRICILFTTGDHEEAMITRSRARAKRESTPTSMQHSGIARKAKVPQIEHISPLSYERKDMGRRGGTSGRRTSTRKKAADTSNVTPIRLFSMAEEDIREEESVSRRRILLESNSSSEGHTRDQAQQQPYVVAEEMEIESGSGSQRCKARDEVQGAEEGYASASDEDGIQKVHHVSEDVPIPHCIGLSREEWCKKEVCLIDNNEVAVATGYVEFCREWQSIDGHSALGADQVAVVVCEVLQHGISLQPRTLRSWPVKKALFQGVSLYDQEHKYNERIAANVARSLLHGLQKYTSRGQLQHRPKKRKDVLIEEFSIQKTLGTPCCKNECMSQFTPTLVGTLRYEMHHSDSKSKDSIRLGVHRTSQHILGKSSQVCFIEGRIVCMLAWRMVYGVSKSDFYRYRKYATSGRRPQYHSSKGKNKTSCSASQAVQTMSMILTAKADSMPNRPHTKKHGILKGQKVVQRILPNGTKWKNILEEVNKVQKQCGQKPISQSTCSKYRKQHFSEFQIKRRGDGFARCARCDALTRMRDVHAYGSPGFQHATQLLQIHLREQEACRAYYCLSKALACYRPNEVLCIMHDKMDHSKTASPCFASRNKAIDCLMKLPISVTGMLAHGHGDVKYAHYALDFFPADSNQTIGSIAKLLRDLENPPKSSNPSSLFVGVGTTELYEAVLAGSEQCITSIKPKSIPISNPDGLSKLPPILHVQLDNCWRDNKSRYIKCFWSLLVAKGIFEEIQVSFLLVGHTHDDIDASFGRWSMKLREKDYPTIPLLMKSYMDLDDEPVIPALIEEVPDFKSFIQDYISEDELVGHSRGRQFRFYRGANSWPLMQYKLSCTDDKWQPMEGIKLWRGDNDGNAMLPHGNPTSLLARTMKGHAEILKGIKGFIQYWENVGAVDVTGEYTRQHAHLVEYWTRVENALQDPEMEGVDVLCMGFWPQTRQSFNIQTLYGMDGYLREEFGEDDHYIGPRSLRPKPSFCIGRDCRAGYFLLVRPAPDSECAVWLGVAKSDPILTFGDANYKMIKVKWYKPCVRFGKESMPYQNWDTASQFKWEEDVSYEEQMTSTSSVMTAWKPKRESTAGIVVIPNRHIIIALAKLAQSIEAAPNAPELASGSDSE